MKNGSKRYALQCASEEARRGLWEKYKANCDWSIDIVQSNSMLVFHHLTVFKMADEQGALDRPLDQLVNINIRNGLQFFNRIDDLTVSNVGLAAREGDEETLKQLLARGKYKSFCASV